jgi:hypothetical protein
VKKFTPIYKHSGKIAAQNGEIAEYRASYKSNVDCGQAIDKAITDSIYEIYRYDLRNAGQ